MDAESCLEDGEIESDTSVSADNVRVPKNESSAKCLNSNLVTDEDGLILEYVNDRKSDLNCEDRSKHTKGLRKHCSEYDASRQSTILGNSEDFIDEYELLWVRGGSPSGHHTGDSNSFVGYTSHERESMSQYYQNSLIYPYDSDDSYDRSYPSRKKRRNDRSRRKKKRSYRRHRESEKLQSHQSNSDGESNSLEEINENRKLEICKFYLLDCCIKRHICHYMHSDFPCKFYYLGLECENEKPCKFLHGKALNDEMKNALVRHIIAAPRAILGSFKRRSKEEVESLLEAKNSELLKSEISKITINNIVSDDLEDKFLEKYSHNVISEDSWDVEEYRRHKTDNADSTVHLFTRRNNSGQQVQDVVPEHKCLLEENWDFDKEAKCRFKQLSESTDWDFDEFSNKENIKGSNEIKCEENEEKWNTDPQINNKKKYEKELQNSTDADFQNSSNCEGKQLILHPTLEEGDWDYEEQTNNLKNCEFPKADANSTIISPEKDSALAKNSNKSNKYDIEITPEMIMESILSPTWGLEGPTAIVKLDIDETGTLVCRDFDEEYDDSILKLKNHPEIVSENQLKKLEAIGITRLEQLNHLSLAQLSELGMNICGLSKIQYTSQNVLPKLECPTFDLSQSQETSHEPRDSDIIENSKLWETSCDEQPFIPNMISNLEILKSSWTDSFSESINASLDVLDELSTQDLMDDDSKLVIDESDLSDYEEPKNLVCDYHIKTESLDDDKTNDSGINSTWDETNISPVQTERKFWQPNFPPFKSNAEDELTFTERLDKDMKTSNLFSNGDYDMRLPFAPINDFLPATEIPASINSHPPMKYKLIEVYIPEIDLRRTLHGYESLSEQNTLDPRLKRLFQLKNNAYMENISPAKNFVKDEIFSPKYAEHYYRHYNNVSKSSSSLCLDPRKRKEILENISAPIPNCTLILNGYLQKSKWYRDLKSHFKIFVNEILAKFASELNRYHQNRTPDKHFELWTVEGADKIDEILFKLGIYVDPYGDISEISNEKELHFHNETEMHEGIPSLNGIPSLLSLNVGDPPNLNSYSRQQGHMNVPFPGFIPPRLDVPKPGLLGIAPGFEFPPFQGPPRTNIMPYDNPVSSGFYNPMLHRWQPTTPFHTPRPQLHPDDRRRWNIDRRNKNNMKLNRF